MSRLLGGEGPRAVLNGAGAAEYGALAHVVGNAAMSRLLGGEGPRAVLNGAAMGDGTGPVGHEMVRPAMARVRADTERCADQAGRRAEASPPEPEVPLIRHAGAGGVLTEAGRWYFEPLVGGSLEGARVHVGGRAGRLADRAGAQALSYGRNVLVPDGTDLATGRGRGLLGHELAHVAQVRSGPPQVHLKEKVEPHYPTESEQREIEESLKRDFLEPALAAPAPAAPITAAPPPAAQAKEAPVRGRVLDAAARTALAARLKTPLFETLDQLDPGRGGTGAAAPVSESVAMGTAERAREAIYDLFGEYITRTTILTQETGKTPQQRRAAGQVQTTFTAPSSLISSTAYTVVQTHCQECSRELAALDDASRSAVQGALLAMALTQRRDQVQRIVQQSVPGAYSEDLQRMYLSLGSTDLFGTAVHELIHRMAHPAFNAAFMDERNIIEGFTEYFTRQVVTKRKGESYPKPFGAVTAVSAAAKKPFLFSGVGGSNEESLRHAYFRGRLDLIGWRPSGPDERKAVEEAGGSAPWDPAVARAKEAAYRAGWQAEQAAHANALGVGLYFPNAAANGRLAVRYARVIAQDEPYAKWRGLLEGQLVGPPIRDPRSLAASLGVAGEYQEPYFHLGAGVRLVGDLVGADGDRKLNLMPFGFAGIRAWQRIQVGAEGFVLLPLAGRDQEKALGVAATVGVEF
jgi:Domain of unknown function (DUF4157)